MSQLLPQIGNATIRQDNGQEWVLSYYVQCAEGNDGEKLYSLRVDKSTLDGVLHESKETFAIHISEEKITEMAHVFLQGTVPPSTLIEVAEEWCGSVEFGNCLVIS